MDVFKVVEMDVAVVVVLEAVETVATLMTVTAVVLAEGMHLVLD